MPRPEPPSRPTCVDEPGGRELLSRTSGNRPLAGRTILGVFAHPDDESLACGGTLARASDAGARVVVFCASRGEAGSTSDPALAPPGSLGLVRTRELGEAASVLGRVRPSVAPTGAGTALSSDTKTDTINSGSIHLIENKHVA